MNKGTSVLFLNLKTFSATGGIEKVCRIAGKALNEISNEKGYRFSIFSLHDHSEDAKDNKYYPLKIFKGFNSQAIKFIISSIFKKRENKNIVIISHINLLVVGYLIKLFSPRTKLVLFAHGIEIWNRLNFSKTKMLRACDLLLAVSHFTKDKIIELHQFPSANIKVFNNCLDPYLIKGNEKRPELLLNKLGLKEKDKILLAVARYSNEEKYKGCDQVIKAMAELQLKYPDLHYILVGKYDILEKERLDILINKLNLKGRIIFTGYIPDDELAQYYYMSDAFVMPSNMEGFGIVFIEAVFHGLPVIAGNKDGTCDALLNGKLGLLVDPDNIHSIQLAIENVLENLNENIPDHDLLLQNFAYPVYKDRLNKFLEHFYQNN